MITEDRACFNGVHTRRLSVSGNGTPIALHTGSPTAPIRGAG
jgi:hypothetical protein